MSPIYEIFDELATILAQSAPEKVKSLKATPAVYNRFVELSSKKKSTELSIQEYEELNHFIILERLLRLAKIKADN